MSLRNAVPLAVHPKGLSDALDGSTVPSGSMASLQNLIPDPSTAQLWQCRPAGQQLVNFRTGGGPFSEGFSPGFQGGSFVPLAGLISVFKIVGSVVYGMVSTSIQDVPFAYSLMTNSFLPISGVTNANVPTSPATTGEWIPPTMDLVGAEILVTHPGFNGSGGVYFGWFDISDPNAITWSGGNLTGLVTFTTPPSVVRNFNGRAYWVTNPPTGQPALIYSDVLVPRNVTNANQILTFDDNVPLTALAGLPLNNLTGGILQGLIVFKGVTNMYQITGDAATSNLAKNALNVATGTLAPNSVAPTAKGLGFIAPDGLRFIDFNANVTDPIGFDGVGKVLPFIYTVVPSRICAAANGSVYRVTTQDGSLVGSPWVEYWYDMTRKIFSGPHTLPASFIAFYKNTFIVAPRDKIASLFQSDYVQTATSTFTENDITLGFTWTTSMLPDTDQMAENNMLETTIYMALNAGATYTAFALDQDGAILQSAVVSNANPATLWGNFTWGQAVWGGAANSLFPRPLNWPAPVVFRRMQISVTGASSAALRVGTLHMRYQQLGYLQQVVAA